VEGEGGVEVGELGRGEEGWCLGCHGVFVRGCGCGFWTWKGRNPICWDGFRFFSDCTN